MLQNISQLCTIQLGHTARGRLELADHEGVPAVQLRDTRPEGGVFVDAVSHYRLDPVPERYWVRSGDVLFRSRGEKNTATLLGAEFDGPAVAVMPLVILRSRQESLDPAYLAWCINQPSAQRHFDECARGTGIRMIPVGCLGKLAIPVPDLATQRAIAEVDQLAAREQSLATRLADKRRQLTVFTLYERANRTSSNQNGTNRAAAPRSGKQRDK